MDFATSLTEGLFLKRYKRFFADVQIPGFAEPQVAHVANTGSLRSVLGPDIPCLLSPATNPERKLRWTLEALKAKDGSWIGINTALPNKLGPEIFAKKQLAHWAPFSDLQSEVKINAKTRLDLCLTKGQQKHFVEIKNITLRMGDDLCFPDAVTERGQKHLLELIELKAQGHGAEILFIAQRTDAGQFSAADEIDPEYSRLLGLAAKKGVLITALAFEFTHQGLHLKKNLKVKL